MADIELPWPADTRLVRLGEIEIDPRYRKVSRAGVVHELNPRCFELLLLFLREPRVLHTRDAIFRRVWRGAVVEDANLTTSIWLLRRALGGAAKQWIRTISKQGYIFDPPASLDIEFVGGDETLAAATRPAGDANLDPDAPTAAPAEAAAAESMTPSLLSRTNRSITRGRALALTVAACLSLMLLAGGLLGARNRDTPATRVVLVAAADPSLPDTQRWPLRLLQHWLSWQLGNAPQVELRSPSDVLADGSETVVLLELGTPAQGGEWRVSAHFRGDAALAPIVQQAGDKQLVAAIAAVGDAVVARLSGVSGYTAPPLALDTASAPQLADAFDAEQQHRWNDAVRAYTSVVAAAPGFGLARLRLARCLAQLGQRSAAQAELARADAWLQSLPEFLRAPLKAEGLALRGEPAAAAAAYAALQQARHGDDAEYRVAEAA
ncbi:winged helix-turn-helix domain-containing protein, partial [Tahibacter caeni]|uniref:winged helix-turn-helix domain-containing protein n=1 Tax=Tahibacter caeni TaxID=1453545 RepID=UPI002148F134